MLSPKNLSIISAEHLSVHRYSMYVSVIQERHLELTKRNCAKLISWFTVMWPNTEVIMQSLSTMASWLCDTNLLQSLFSCACFLQVFMICQIRYGDLFLNPHGVSGERAVRRRESDTVCARVRTRDRRRWLHTGAETTDAERETPRASEVRWIHDCKPFPPNSYSQSNQQL